MIRLAIPVILTYLGMMTMNIVDLLFVGKVSAVAIGAVGVGGSVFAWFMISGIGMLSGLEYLVSHSIGAGNDAEGRHYFIQGGWISFLFGVPLTALIFFLSYRLHWLGINPAVEGDAASYLRILSLSLIPVYIFTATRMFLQAYHLATAAMVILIAANVLNLVSNYCLVLGHWGFPPMGATGSAWATLFSRVWMALALIVYLIWKKGGHFSRKVLALDPPRMRELFRLGTPSALQMTFEVGVFALATTLAARLAPAELAAHQIVLNIASTTFMVPLGLSSATAVLVGREIGRKSYRQASLWGWRGLTYGLAFMGLSCFVLLVFSQELLGFYTQDPEVIRVAQGILFIAALFQISDGAQTVAAGALRGLGKTRASMFANLIGHWLIGLPVGITLCYRMDWSLKGLWTGLSLGLTVVAFALVFHWRLAIRALRARDVTNDGMPDAPV